MPLGSQEGGSSAQAVEQLKTQGREQRIGLRELGLTMQGLLDDYDSSAAKDVLAMLATRVLSTLPAAGGQAEPAPVDDVAGPPMDARSDEASEEQLAAARAQGDAYGKALALMTSKVANDGGEQRAGDYLIGYALEEAEGMYRFEQGGLQWLEPRDENLHVEVAVRDAGDGRFLPALTVYATLIAGDGGEVGTHEQPLLWHPMLLHYGRNWKVPGDGEYTLRVRVEPATFMRHDEVNGRRFTEPVEVEFAGVKVQTGQK